MNKYREHREEIKDNTLVQIEVVRMLLPECRNVFPYYGTGNPSKVLIPNLHC